MAPTELQQAEERSAREAASGSRDKRAYVKAMFSDIAPRYDLLNHLLSFNVDRRWRRRAIRMLAWERAPTGVYLDLCAATLQLRRAGFQDRVKPATFTAPLGPVVPIIAILVSMAVVAGASRLQLLGGTAALAVGAVLFLLAPLRQTATEAPGH